MEIERSLKRQYAGKRIVVDDRRPELARWGRSAGPSGRGQLERPRPGAVRRQTRVGTTSPPSSLKGSHRHERGERRHGRPRLRQADACRAGRAVRCWWCRNGRRLLAIVHGRPINVEFSRTRPIRATNRPVPPRATKIRAEARSPGAFAHCGATSPRRPCRPAGVCLSRSRASVPTFSAFMAMAPLEGTRGRCRRQLVSAR